MSVTSGDRKKISTIELTMCYGVFSTSACRFGPLSPTNSPLYETVWYTCETVWYGYQTKAHTAGTGWYTCEPAAHTAGTGWHTCEPNAHTAGTAWNLGETDWCVGFQKLHSAKPFGGSRGERLRRVGARQPSGHFRRCRTEHFGLAVDARQTLRVGQIQVVAASLPISPPKPLPPSVPAVRDRAGAAHGLDAA